MKKEERHKLIRKFTLWFSNNEKDILKNYSKDGLQGSLYVNEMRISFIKSLIRDRRRSGVICKKIGS